MQCRLPKGSWYLCGIYIRPQYLSQAAPLFKVHAYSIRYMVPWACQPAEESTEASHSLAPNSPK